MTLYYKVLAQCFNKPQKSAEIDYFWSQKRADSEQDVKQKTQNKILRNNDYPHLNANRAPETISKPICSNNERIQDKEIDEFKVTSEAVTNCNNKPCPLEAITTGVVAKIPVILAGLTLQLNLDSIINLPECVHEIKQAKKRVKITQCTLLHDNNVLFIKGLVCRTIEYTVKSVLNSKRLSGEICHWDGEVPFTCTTTVGFNGVKPVPVKAGSTCQIEYLKTKNRQECEAFQKDNPVTCDVSELNQISTVFYNELLFCELVESKIVEVNEMGNILDRSSKAQRVEGMFNCIKEKMIIHLTLNILQYQQVAIAPI